MRQKIFAYLHYINFEALIWIAGLGFLAILNPNESHHLSICPIQNLGFSFCPGCGLGESISHLFRLQVGESFLAHPLGIVALPILIYRIIFLLRKSHSGYQINFSQKLGVPNNG